MPRIHYNAPFCVFHGDKINHKNRLLNMKDAQHRKRVKNGKEKQEYDGGKYNSI
jgi:hypothetical protein